jgi:Peptidase family M28
MTNRLRYGIPGFAVAGAVVLGVAAAGCGATRAPGFSADSVMVHVDRQLALGPRVPGTPARDRAAAYLGRVLRERGARVSVQDFTIEDPYFHRPLRLINVIGSFEPDRKRRLMLAAHYDSRPWADQEADTTLWTKPIPAAVDGACGAGILLEVARALSERAPKDVGVDIVFFDGEDYGKESDIDNYLLGSKHFAATLAGYHPMAAILLDMVGGKGTQVRREGYSADHARALVDWVFNRARTLGLSYFAEMPGAPMYDDHVPLLQAGVRTVDLFGYDYGPWHTLGDDASQCDKDKIRQVGVLLTSLVYNFDLTSR